MTVASFSALAIVTAAVLYLMALVFHTLEWALARNVEATVTESVAADGKGGVALLDKPSVAPVPPRKADVFARMGFNLTILAAVTIANAEKLATVIPYALSSPLGTHPASRTPESPHPARSGIRRGSLQAEVGSHC